MNDREPASLIGAGLTGLIENLRDDVREDMRDLRQEIKESERRMTERVKGLEDGQADTRDLIEAFSTRHGQQHETEAEERRESHSEFYNFIRTAEIDTARKDGALGVVRWSIELLSRHAPQLIAIIIALAAALGLTSGNINLTIR